MTIYIVWAESNDWCGVVSNMYRVEAPSEFIAEDIAVSIHDFDAEIMEFYTSDEEDEEYIEDPSISIHVEEYDENMHGSLDIYTKIGR